MHSCLSALKGAFAILLFAAATSPACADFNLGTAANYSVVALGNGSTISLNSGPNAGSFLLGNGVKAAFSGGGGGSIGGTLYYDNTVTGTNTFSQLQTAPTTQLVSTSITNAALVSANSVGSYAAGLTATQTFTNINSATTFNGNGGLNVIDVNNITNAPLTFKGSASDTFVINVSGTFQTNVAMTLTGVNASQILFNFTGTSGDVFMTSGGNTVYGTFLATKGGNFQFSNLNLTGELINTDGDMHIVSGSQVTKFVAFTPTPVPSTLVMASTGLVMGLGYWLRHRKRAARD